VIARRLKTTLALAPYAERNNGKSQHEKAGQHHIGENSKIWTWLCRGDVNHEQDDDVGKRDSR
jgi:hypothetical protein